VLELPHVAPMRGPGKRTAVFYNPAMALDRDLGVAVLTAWRTRMGHSVRGWEMMGATGVRALRLLNETEALDSLLCTDAHPMALAVLSANAARVAPDRTTVDQRDARDPPDGPAFGYVDLDPFGSPMPYLASALSALAPDGLLGVTATDLMVLGGVTRGACERKYRATPIRGRFAPEAGLRILLAALEREARTRGLALHVWLAYAHDHYVRAYVSLPRGESTDALESRSISPASWDGPNLPPGGPYGPLWLGPLFDPGFVPNVQPPVSAARPREVLELIQRFHEESRVDRPFYYEPNEIARSLHLPEPPSLASLRSGLEAEGWGTARTHARASGFRTTAPRSVVEAVAQSQKARVFA
jgi:tRNA (guanine26-N2/guanine27-N2)-dimethyltransferase